MESRSRNKHIYLAILPLQNLSDDSSIEQFCTGLVMDLITDLSRFRSFQIISYDAIKNIHPNEKINSPELHKLKLDYLLKGLVRFHNGKLIVNVQLINARENHLVWAEKFSGHLEELFDIQDEIVKKMVVSLQQFVDYDLLSHIQKKSITNLNAYECWLKGYQEVKKGTVEADGQARKYFKQAMEIDPHFSRAYTGMSLTYFNEWSCQIWDRWEVSQKGAFGWAQKAVELDEWDHISTAILGRIFLFNEEYEKAEHFFRKALRLNPNDSDNLIKIAFCFGYLGYLKEARQLYEKAKRLNPAGGDSYFACGALIHFESGDFDKTIELAKRHQFGKSWVDFSAYLAAAYYQKGNLKEMQVCWQDYIYEFSKKINQGKPADTQTALRWMIDVNPYKTGTRLKPFWEYLSDGHQNLTPTPPDRPSMQENHFRMHDGFWSLLYAGKQVQLSDLKGMHDLKRLLSTPHREVHCTELMGAKVIEGGAPVFDEKARESYRLRILEIQQELEEAESNHAIGRTETLQEEYDDLLDHLSKSIGRNGNARKVSGSIEKARTAVTWRIRSAIKKIAGLHPELGHHLDISVKTGIFCEYTPEHDINWII